MELNSLPEGKEGSERQKKEVTRDFDLYTVPYKLQPVP